MSVDALRPHRLLVAADGDGLQQIDLVPDLSIAAQGPTSVIGHGRPVTITYTVRNRGPFDATDVRTTIGLGSGATNVVATASNGTCSRSGSAVVCSERALRVGATATITVTFAESATGSFRIPAVLEAAQPDLVAADNTASVEVTVAEVADLSIAATGPSNVNEGGTSAYVLTITNVGPNGASAVRMTFQPPAGLSIASVTPSTGSCESSGSGPVTCTIGALAASARATVSIASGVLAVGTFQSTFEISSDGVDLTMGNNSGTITTTVTKPAPPTGSGSGSGGGGGGGGSTSWWMAIALLGLSMARGRGKFGMRIGPPATSLCPSPPTQTRGREPPRRRVREALRYPDRVERATQPTLRLPAVGPCVRGRFP
ncbi:DUF11 domain-containing protein [Povalibacter sp.]|uniref:DUF11 domain-containing protein n=1 Tax=Povalibacter sp. TaxID=1962978 RepID=UPI0032C20E38